MKFNFQKRGMYICVTAHTLEDAIRSACEFVTGNELLEKFKVSVNGGKYKKVKKLVKGF